ncbi:dipeptidyl-peptidase 7. Serine peptidase. MEROPS family S46 [Mucilaginibacter pineti]|uniref:Dipeptidyl-peptidase n=1 Tax=Mucilaginibacter pineti TaxID=1391627 RepID=A0A1G7EZ18_9SPHI|nr:S46 family peptidase [Mucilaginibacter pineti]SDE68716.1 dipeptidyl-peptidase 7. Serine peptidase. MEROPS family S46 [Mucilaginibacter pineti]
MTKLKLVFVMLLLPLLFAEAVKADEGMWIPMLIGKNYDQMKKQGFKLTPEDLYNINKASIKDAIVSLGGGFCTGEVVSNKGLVFTNHHCGYESISANSTPQNDILDNGFYAKSYQEEKAIPGLFVQFLVRMEDVTPQITAALKGATDANRAEKIKEASDAIIAKATAGGAYEGAVKDFFNGNQYFLYLYETYNDVRLVGAPPQSIGKFGGDTDNWEWPRHTGDFSIFRIYSGKDGKPAAYSADNVPLTPKKFLPVSIKGVKNGDFAMVYGYPGKTDRFLTSNGVKVATEETNPVIVKLRDIRLKAWKEEMNKSVDTRLKLSSKYAEIANYWKYFIGQTEQLKQLGIYDQKQKEEAAFTKWAANKPAYAGLMDGYKKLYAAYDPYAVHNTYIEEGLLAPGFVVNTLITFGGLRALEQNKNDPKAVEQIQKELKEATDNYLKTYNVSADKKIFVQIMAAYYADVPKDQHPQFVEDIIAKYPAPTVEGTFSKLADDLWANSAIIDSTKLKTFMQNPSADAMFNDPAFLYARNVHPRLYSEKVFGKKVSDFEAGKDSLDRIYLKALLEKNQDKLMYPDANSTMRISYGNVQDYTSKEGKHFEVQTTLDEVMKKYKPGDDEFDLPKSLITAYNNKQFGQYGMNGTVPVCFITNDDITGGNSGSPVINGNGELIGLAFDGNWEAMSGDIAFDKKYKRTICVDIRYVLWCMDILGGANNLISELDIHKN